MLAAVTLARRALGRAWPNPAVGCVVVRDGVVAARAHTGEGGRPHAEAAALEKLGGRAQGAAVYATLEPCSHHGRTPPCAEALIAAGAARVVIAAGDPDPRVDGRGVAALRGAGIEVETGVCADEAEDLLAGYFMRVRAGRPLVTLKLASTLDSRIAARSGESRWITGEAARRHAHLLRARHDAVLVGGRTAVLDDPALTCRLPGLEKASPVRVVAEGRDALPRGSALVATAAQTPTWLAVPKAREAERRAALRGTGVVVVPVDERHDGRVDLSSALRALGSKGITSVLAEGGARLAAGLVGAGLVDRIVWYRAPSLLGGDGREALEALGIGSLDAAPRFTKTSARSVGQDVVEVYRPAPQAGQKASGCSPAS